MGLAQGTLHCRDPRLVSFAAVTGCPVTWVWGLCGPCHAGERRSTPGGCCWKGQGHRPPCTALGWRPCPLKVPFTHTLPADAIASFASAIATLSSWTLRRG